jgi:hypothetical protein
MSSFSTVPLYDVKQDHLAFAPHGELMSMFVSPCVIVIVIFDDGSLLMEHWSDPLLGRKGNLDETMNLLRNISQHVIDFKGEETNSGVAAGWYLKEGF